MDDPQLEGELERLCDSLPPETALLVGGRAMPAYRDTLEQAGAVLVENLAHLGATLDGLRTSRQPAHRKARR